MGQGVTVTGLFLIKSSHYTHLDTGSLMPQTARDRANFFYFLLFPGPWQAKTTISDGTGHRGPASHGALPLKHSISLISGVNKAHLFHHSSWHLRGSITFITLHHFLRKEEGGC